VKGRAASPRRLRLRRRLCWAEHGTSGEDRWAGRGRNWALCDGASEGFDGAGWAACLARQLVRSPSVDQAVARARALYARDRQRGQDGVDWLAELGALRGSWSTVLFLRLSRAGSLVQVWARGDTVFLLRDGDETRASFPLDDPGAFGTHPELVADRPDAAADSVPAGAAGASGPFRRAAYSLRRLRRPLLVLATDALAQRILRAEGPDRRRLWAFLDRCSAAEFGAWARAEMDAGRLVRDDLTLLELAP